MIVSIRSGLIRAVLGLSLCSMVLIGCTEEPEPELAEAASDDDPVAEKRAMDQARSLSAAVRGYGINRSSTDDLVPGY